MMYGFLLAVPRVAWVEDDARSNTMVNMSSNLQKPGLVDVSRWRLGFKWDATPKDKGVGHFARGPPFIAAIGTLTRAELMTF
jgi:hypothetical protein